MSVRFGQARVPDSSGGQDKSRGRRASLVPRYPRSTNRPRLRDSILRHDSHPGARRGRGVRAARVCRLATTPTLVLPTSARVHYDEQRGVEMLLH